RDLVVQVADVLLEDQLRILGGRDHPAEPRAKDAPHALPHKQGLQEVRPSKHSLRSLARTGIRARHGVRLRRAARALSRLEAGFRARRAGRLLASGTPGQVHRDLGAYAGEGAEDGVQVRDERAPDDPLEVVYARLRRQVVTGEPVFRTGFPDPPAHNGAIQAGRTAL